MNQYNICKASKFECGSNKIYQNWSVKYMSSFAKRMDGVSGSVIREILKLMGDPEIISFGGGNPSKESFPIQLVETITNEVLEQNGANILQYGTTEGYAPLRESYLEHIAWPKGIEAEVQNVLTLTGSSQGIDLLTKVYIDPGDVVLVESPTFLGALQTFNTYQAKCVPVEMDDEGTIPENLEEQIKKHHPKLFYCIPTFQNPTGKTLGVERRKQIAALAEKYDIIVIEDDPYGDLRFRGTAVPPIKTFDKSGHVVMLNSFSKILSPGLRVGIAVATPEILRKMTVAKQGVDTHTSNLSQAIADGFLRKGMLPTHLKEICPDYLKRLDAMLGGLAAFFPEGFKYTKPEGGLFVWGELPKAIDMPALLARATKEIKVAFIPGQYFYVDPAVMGQNTMRFNFSSATPERITIGLEKLGKLVKEVL